MNSCFLRSTLQLFRRTSNPAVLQEAITLLNAAGAQRSKSYRSVQLSSHRAAALPSKYIRHSSKSSSYFIRRPQHPVIMPSVQLEQRIRGCVMSALKAHFTVPTDKTWVLEFIAESVLASLIPVSANEPSTAQEQQSNSSNATPQSGSNNPLEQQNPEAGMLVSFSMSDLPPTPEAAESTWGQLVYDQLEDIDPDDVRDFSRQVLDDLTALAHELDDSHDGTNEEEAEGSCEMCERVMPLTKHHLIPRDVHKEWKKKGATFDELQAGAMVCRGCHNAIHRVADNKTLAKEYSTLQQLLQVPSIQRHIGWARKQKVAARPETLPAKFRNRR